MENPSLSKKPEARLAMSPQMAKSEAEKQRARWSSIDGVNDFFDRRSRLNFKKMRDFDTEDNQQSYRRYNSLQEQLGKGEYGAALSELESLLYSDTKWNNESKRAEHKGNENTEELRALAITLTKLINKKRGDKSGQFSPAEQNAKFKELRGFLGEELRFRDLDEEAQTIKSASETFDYKYLATTIDGLIDTTKWEIGEIPQDKNMQERVKTEARGRGNANTDMTLYLYAKLKKLREYRQLLYEKSYLGKK